MLSIPEAKAGDSKSGDLEVLICSAWRNELIMGVYKTKTHILITTLERTDNMTKEAVQHAEDKLFFSLGSWVLNYSLMPSLLWFFLITVHNYGLPYHIQTCNADVLLQCVWQESDS